jgi:hypothetical protein
MPKVGKHTGKSPITVRTHIFGFITPNETKKFNMPDETNACYACHKDKTLDSLQENLKEWGKLAWEKLEQPAYEIESMEAASIGMKQIEVQTIENK